MKKREPMSGWGQTLGIALTRSSLQHFWSSMLRTLYWASAAAASPSFNFWISVGDDRGRLTLIVILLNLPVNGSTPTSPS